MIEVGLTHRKDAVWGRAAQASHCQIKRQTNPKTTKKKPITEHQSPNTTNHIDDRVEMPIAQGARALLLRENESHSLTLRAACPVLFPESPTRYPNHMSLQTRFGISGSFEQPFLETRPPIRRLFAVGKRLARVEGVGGAGGRRQAHSWRIASRR